MREVAQHTFGASLKKFFSLIVLLLLITFLTGCPEGGEAGEGAAAEGAAAEGAPASEAAAAEGAEGTEASEGSSSEIADSAEELGTEALKAAEEDGANEPTHFFARIKDDGIIETIDELGFRSELVGRFDSEGQLWEVNRAGAPIRPIAQIRSGQLWEVNRAGDPIRVIGQLRATIQGTNAIDIYAEPRTDFGRIGVLRPGNIIEIVTSKQDWLFIRQANGDEGWVQSAIPLLGPNKEEHPSSRFQTYDENGLYSVSVPYEWNEERNGDSVTFCPTGSYFGRGRVSRGVILGVVHQPSSELERATDNYVETLRQNNPNLYRSEGYHVADIEGRTWLWARFSNTDQGPETVTISTTFLRSGDLLYMIAVAPQGEYSNYQETFRTVLHSLNINE